MNRRSSAYQDLLYTMEFSANPHGYGRKEAMRYRFGYISGVGGQEGGDVNIVRDVDRLAAPVLIGEEVEEEPVCEVVANLLETDLVLVPVTQIRPQDGRVTLDKHVEPEVITDKMKEEMKAARDKNLIASIDLSRYSPEKIAAANRGRGREEEEREEEEAAMARAE